MFKKAMEHTLQFEGGYANDPDDRGGETFRGISRRNWASWPGWSLIDIAKKRGATTAKNINATFEGDAEMKHLVASFYHKNFWKPFQPLEASERIVAKLFDTAVNMGVSRAVKFLQTTHNLLEPNSPIVVDGAIGTNTITSFGEALKKPEAELIFLELFCTTQGKFYKGIVRRKPRQGKFLKGWLRRAAWLPN